MCAEMRGTSRVKVTDKVDHRRTVRQGRRTPSMGRRFRTLDDVVRRVGIAAESSLRRVASPRSSRS